ncbi:MAG: hypothetical protein KAS66_10400 [Candidatus Omnitrophica bacterium]|nr:hypothetical protein [Candidatus Omnitrophota bacterium]
MRRIHCVLFIVFVFLINSFPGSLYADLDNNQVINHAMARRISELREKSGYSSEDFNACQVTWTVRELKKPDSYSQFQPHEITFQYNNQEIIKLVNAHDGKAESIQDLGLHCLEFNDYVYLFFDTSPYETRMKFHLSDLSYVTYSSDQGASWSELKSLHPFSAKAKFILPYNRFEQYTKIFGNTNNHVLSIFNLLDETTYLFDAEFNILKTLSVYNRLSNFDNPTDFYWHNDTLYLVRGSCEKVRGRLQCPARTYMETSKDFGKYWERQTLAFTKKSFFITLNDTLYRFYSTSCRSSWFGLIPAINRSNKCGYIKVEKLDENGKWEKAKILIKTVSRLFDVYRDEKPILVWQDLRFHKSRPCGYIPLVGCVDSTPFRGPTVIYAGELDITNWHIDESIITYKN